MAIKALVFDMDGLVFDTERVVQRTWARAGAELGYPGMENVIYHTLGLNRKRRTEFFREYMGEDFPDEEFSRRTRKYFYEIAKEEGIAVKKGIRELIVFAKERGLKLAVATSSSEEHASGLFKNAGLYEYFDAFVYGNMVKNSKPDPECYRSACEALGVSPKDAAALEDAPAGIEAAYRAGMKPIMIPDLAKVTEEVEAMAWRVCEHAGEVADLLLTNVC